MGLFAMPRSLWWIASVLLMTLGCGKDQPTTNPNEADFPGAPGSRVPAPTPPSGGGGGFGGGSASGGNLPSTYPGMEKRSEPSKEAAPSADGPKAEYKDNQPAPNAKDEGQAAPKG
jgi:hypothetical protein